MIELNYIEQPTNFTNNETVKQFIEKFPHQNSISSIRFNDPNFTKKRSKSVKIVFRDGRVRVRGVRSQRHLTTKETSVNESNENTEIICLVRSARVLPSSLNNLSISRS